MPYPADDLDMKILGLLKEDSRMTHVAIADRLDVSEGSVRQRIRKMVEGGLIRRFTISTSSQGIKAIVELGVKVNVHTSSIAKKIKAIEGVEEVFEISGDSDIVAIVDVDDVAQLNDVIEKMRAGKSVTSTATKMILKEL
jgi:DNA-binding Lrp family transcriptional regulator